MVGSEYLFGPEGLDPKFWGVSKSQLLTFKTEVASAIQSGFICGQPDDTKPHYYPNSKFSDKSIGPNVHQVNAGLIRPLTAATPGLPGMCYAVWKNLSVGGLLIKLFFSHAWNEGIFEFIDKAVAGWPEGLAGDDCGGYMCPLSNPQNLDLGKLCGAGDVTASPFHRVLASKPPPSVIMVANCSTPIHERKWCVYEAYLAEEFEAEVHVEGEVQNLLTGRLRKVLQHRQELAFSLQEAAAETAREVFERALLGDKQASVDDALEQVRDADEQVAQAKVDVLLASDKELVDLAKAECFNANDSKMIDAAIRGREPAVMALVARQIREVVCRSARDKSEVLPRDKSEVDVGGFDLSRSSNLLQFAAWLWRRPAVKHLRMNGCKRDGRCERLLQRAFDAQLLAPGCLKEFESGPNLPQKADQTVGNAGGCATQGTGSGEVQSHAGTLECDAKSAAKVECYVRALECDAKSAFSWYCLGFEGGGKVAGTDYSKAECHVRALECDAKYAKAWYRLGLAGGGKVAGTDYSEAECYVMALECDAKYALSWFCLGLVGGGKVAGTDYSQVECYVRALECDAKTSASWYCLGLEGGGKVAGTDYSKVECYARALESDAKYAEAWRCLGVEGGGKVAGTDYSEAECYAMEAALNG